MSNGVSAAKLDFSVRAVGLVGPGMPDWLSARSRLADPTSWQPAPTVLPAAQRLPPAERRRAGDIVKLSMAVADQACAAAGIDPVDLATVFSSSTGDGSNCHALCEALAGAERIISPTRFTNSVHNAAAGYWHIATRSQAPSTSLCAHDAGFGAGLLEAVVQCVSGQRPVLLVVADLPYPQPLASVRPISDSFGVALLLCPVASADQLAAASLRFGSGDIRSTCDDTGLELLRQGNPSARALPLLQALARGESTTLLIDYLRDIGLSLDLAPSESRPACP